MVLDEEVGKSLRLDKAEFVSHQDTAAAFTVVIGISGALEGFVFYGLPESVAEAIVTMMLDGG